MADMLKAPFPYFGGKAKIAPLVWQRLGTLENYIEPFAGSLAVLLANPYGVPIKETINDANHYLVNFWRAIQAEPDSVAKWADYPVHECDLHGRHEWLMRSPECAESLAKARADADYYCPKIAGWWAWGLSCWIGGGWCVTEHLRMPDLTSGRTGPGRGVNAGTVPKLSEKIPHLNNSVGMGVNAGPAPFPGTDGTCDFRRQRLIDWFRALSDRLRMVRSCYGHWSRVCDSESTLTRLGTTGVFLDPPYPTERGDGSASRRGGLYSRDDSGAALNDLRDEILDWCHKWGANPKIRVAVCGYDTDGYAALESAGWDCVPWKANGGYSGLGKAGKFCNNAARECVWFSPYTIKPDRGLFESEYTTDFSDL